MDLIVDFGNTRSVALLLARSQAAHGTFSEITQPVRFGYRKSSRRPGPGTRKTRLRSWTRGSCWRRRPSRILSCWIKSCRRICLTGWRPRAGRRRGRICGRSGRRASALSPAPCGCRTCLGKSPSVLGPPAADILANTEPSAGGNHFLSPPKRYLWGQMPVADLGQAGLTYWTMNVQVDTNSKMAQAGKTLEKLWGPCCVSPTRTAPTGPWVTTRPDARRPSAPTPPRARLPGPTSRPTRAPTRSRQPSWRCWKRLTGSFNRLPAAPPGTVCARAPGLGDGHVSALLDGEEPAAYRRKWQKALDIFAPLTSPIAGSYEGGERPSLSMELDQGGCPASICIR